MMLPGETRRRFNHILVADDSPTMRARIRAALVPRGYVLTEVADGTAALEALLAPDAPHLAILDWEMPGLEGIEVCEDLRARGHHATYVLLLTGHDDAVTGLESGANDFLRKPFREEELVARLRVGERMLSLSASLQERITELEQERSNVRELQSLLPVCMHCHSVRSDAFQWERLDHYLARHSIAQISHGVCETCLEKHHPEANAL